LQNRADDRPTEQIGLRSSTASEEFLRLVSALPDDRMNDLRALNELALVARGRVWHD
jgi:hypothetical protein